MNRLRSNQLPVVQLRDALASGLGALPDAELLDRFARYADQPAFEVLLRRHGPMVFGVCRRTLLNPADADDAFQATFLVFLRRAKTVRGERLGPWLYGVAWRVSQKARTRAARLAARRTEGVEMLPAADENAPIPDWLPVLDAELNALPAKYRDALVLCDLQGRSRAEAARALGLREGTLSSRLSRGRELLRKRLLKHGTLLPAGGLAALFGASEVGRATVPASLLATVSERAKTGAAAGAVSVGAARLTDEVLRSMFRTKLQIPGGALVSLVLATVGLAAALPRETPVSAGADRPAAPKTKTEPPVPAPPPKPRPVEPDAKTVQGYWKVEKFELPHKVAADPEGAKYRARLATHTYILVEGDVWWFLMGNQVMRHEMELAPERNPKWLDSPTVHAERTTIMGMRGIYRLPDADTLELCFSFTESKLRPAEFVIDDDHETSILRLKRHRLPEIPAGDRAARETLHGTWNPAAPGKEPGAGAPVVFTSHFAFIPGQENDHTWGAYTYTVDTEKDPAWIDLTHANAELAKEDGLKPIYGAYAHRRLDKAGTAGLSMALGEGGKRVARPLEFKADKESKVRVLELVRPGAREPMPKVKAAPWPQAEVTDPRPTPTPEAPPGRCRASLGYDGTRQAAPARFTP